MYSFKACFYFFSCYILNCVAAFLKDPFLLILFHLFVFNGISLFLNIMSRLPLKVCLPHDEC